MPDKFIATTVGIQGKFGLNNTHIARDICFGPVYIELHKRNWYHTLKLSLKNISFRNVSIVLA